MTPLTPFGADVIGDLESPRFPPNWPMAVIVARFMEPRSKQNAGNPTYCLTA